jgi:hypothetical protein
MLYRAFSGKTLIKAGPFRATHLNGYRPRSGIRPTEPARTARFHPDAVGRRPTADAQQATIETAISILSNASYPPAITCLDMI